MQGLRNRYIKRENERGMNMNDEKLDLAKKLRGEITDVTRHLQLAKSGVTITYYNKEYHSLLPIPKDTLAVIQIIVVAVIEKKLAELQNQFDKL